MDRIDQLLTLAREYGAAHRVELSTVSWRVFGDTKKLAAMESGADIQTRRYDRAILWFSENWPENIGWPAGVPRPSLTSPTPTEQVAS